MSNAGIHIARSQLKKTQVPNSRATKNSIKVTIWGELADLIFLGAYRLLHIFLPNSTFWPWKCIYVFCYMHLLHSKHKCMVDLITQRILIQQRTYCVVFYWISVCWLCFKGFVSGGDAFSVFQLFYKFLHFPWYTCKCWQAQF